MEPFQFYAFFGRRPDTCRSCGLCVSNNFYWPYSSAVIRPLMYPTSLPQYDSPAFALSKQVYPRSSMWTVSTLLFRFVAGGLESDRSAVPAGLVHMLQLASKTGATLAG